MTDHEILTAVRSPDVTFALGMIAASDRVARMNGGPRDDKIWNGLLDVTAACLCDTVERDARRRLHYIKDKIADSVDFQAVLEPIRSPENFVGHGLAYKVTANYAALISECGLLDLADWRAEQGELARDAAADAEFERMRDEGRGV